MLAYPVVSSVPAFAVLLETAARSVTEKLTEDVAGAWNPAGDAMKRAPRSCVTKEFARTIEPPMASDTKLGRRPDAGLFSAISATVDSVPSTFLTNTPVN